MKVLTDEVIASFKDAARKLTGPKRRAFQAQVTLDYLDGSIWKAEKVFGWSHHTVALGLNELRTGITCQGQFLRSGKSQDGNEISRVGSRHPGLGGTRKPSGPKVSVALSVHANHGQGDAASPHRPERLDG